MRTTYVETITLAMQSRSMSMYNVLQSLVRLKSELASTEISGDFHRNAAVYHAVKNIAWIIRRYSNWIYIHRDSRGPVYQRHEGTRAGINGFFSE